MAEAFIEHIFAMAGIFAVCVGIWFGVRGARGAKARAETRTAEI